MCSQFIDSMSKDEARAALEVIDNTLNDCLCCGIQKAGEGKPLPFENAMVELLLSKWGTATKKSYNEAFKYLKANDSTITLYEKEKILKIIESGIAKQFTSLVESGVEEKIEASYEKAKKNVFKQFKQKLVWDNIDDDVLQWSKNHQMYWIGNYYEKHLSKALSDNISNSIDQGLGRVDAGKKLKEFFDDYPGVRNKPEVYWRGLAANGLNRSRNFGIVQSFVDIKIVNLKVLVIDDERTSEICKLMIGRIIPVSKAVEQRNELMDAKSPEDVKTITPWLSVDELQGLSTEEIIAKGVRIPPYHFHCRTTIVAA